MSNLAIAHRRSVINPLLPLPVPTLYFAYGSNMVSRQMALRCPRSPAIGIARLPDWRFRINAEGWATVVPEPGAVVYGRLWQLTSEDEVALDLYEALPSGLYAKQRVPVVPDGEATANAMVYLASDPRPGMPLARYLTPILSAAAELKFPIEYQTELRRWSPLPIDRATE